MNPNQNAWRLAEARQRHARHQMQTLRTIVAETREDVRWLKRALGAVFEHWSAQSADQNQQPGRQPHPGADRRDSSVEAAGGSTEQVMNEAAFQHALDHGPPAPLEVYRHAYATVGLPWPGDEQVCQLHPINNDAPQAPTCPSVQQLSWQDTKRKDPPTTSRTEYPPARRGDERAALQRLADALGWDRVPQPSAAEQKECNLDLQTALVQARRRYQQETGEYERGWDAALEVAVEVVAGACDGDQAQHWLRRILRTRAGPTTSRRISRSRRRSGQPTSWSSPECSTPMRSWRSSSPRIGGVDEQLSPVGRREVAVSGISGEASVCSAALVGVQAHVVRVCAQLRPGPTTLELYGLPQTSIRKTCDRVRAAVVNSGYTWPPGQVTVTVHPTELCTSGNGYDLAIACAVLTAAGQLPQIGQQVVLIGELRHDGLVRPVRGTLPMALAAAHARIARLICAPANATEAAHAPGVTVKATDTPHRLLTTLHGRQQLLHPHPARAPITRDRGEPLNEPDRALHIAAAGRHHLAITSPGTGTGLEQLASRLAQMLPDLDHTAAVEVAAIQSAAGRLPADQPLSHIPPVQQPAPQVRTGELLGGARPGILSLAHHGVLILHHTSQFHPHTLRALRDPIISAVARVRQPEGHITYPTRLHLVLTYPTPHGHCHCQSGPARPCPRHPAGALHDLIDIHHQPPDTTARPDPATATRTAQPSTRDLVAHARAAAATRWAPHDAHTNTDAPSTQLRRGIPIATLAPLQHLHDHSILTARQCDKILRIAWTIADLHGRARPHPDHITEALELHTGRALTRGWRVADHPRTTETTEPGPGAPTKAAARTEAPQHVNTTNGEPE